MSYCILDMSEAFRWCGYACGLLWSVSKLRKVRGGRKSRTACTLLGKSFGAVFASPWLLASMEQLMLSKGLGRREELSAFIARTTFVYHGSESKYRYGRKARELTTSVRSHMPLQLPLLSKSPLISPLLKPRTTLPLTCKVCALSRVDKVCN